MSNLKERASNLRSEVLCRRAELLNGLLGDLLFFGEVTLHPFKEALFLLRCLVVLQQLADPLQVRLYLLGDSLPVMAWRTASSGQISWQWPHLIHSLSSMTAVSSGMEIAPTGHSCTHTPQPTHISSFTQGICSHPSSLASGEGADESGRNVHPVDTVSVDSIMVDSSNFKRRSPRNRGFCGR